MLWALHDFPVDFQQIRALKRLETKVIERKVAGVVNDTFQAFLVLLDDFIAVIKQWCVKASLAGVDVVFQHIDGVHRLAEVLLCKFDMEIRAAKIEKSGCCVDMYAAVSAASSSLRSRDTRVYTLHNLCAIKTGSIKFSSKP